MRKVSLEYKTTKEFKMLSILRHIRKGMRITCKEIAGAIYYTHLYVAHMESARLRIDEEKLRKYANVISDRMELDRDLFFKELEEEAVKMQEVNNLAILMAISRLVNRTCDFSEEKEEDTLSPKEKMQYAVRILSCIRRILCIPIQNLEKSCRLRTSFKENWKKPISSRYLKKYAKYIGEKIGYSGEDALYVKLMQNAYLVGATEDTYANAIKAIGKILQK